MREPVLRFTQNPEWLPSVSQDITDAIHAELADVNADPELRASTYASTDSVLRLIVDLARTGRSPSVAVANWTFAYIEKLSDGLVQRYGEERKRRSIPSTRFATRGSTARRQMEGSISRATDPTTSTSPTSL